MKKRGFSLVEVLTASALLAIMILAAMSLLANTLRSFHRTDRQVDVSDASAITLRRISEQLRSAVSVEILASGREVAFELPLRNSTLDPLTGEYEYATPVRSDGIDRRYYVNSAGELMYREGSNTPKRIMTRILAKDTDPESVYYNQDYPVFELLRIGNRNSLRIMIIAEEKTSAGYVRNRMSTESLLRNVQ